MTAFDYHFVRLALPNPNSSGDTRILFLPAALARCQSLLRSRM